MKKSRFFSLLMLILISLFLVACNGDDEIDVDQLLSDAQAQITLAGNVTSDITLPTSVDVDGVTVVVTWSSSHPNVVSTTGQVTRQPHDVGNVTVTLTATFTYLDEIKTAPFTVVVEALPVPTYTVQFETGEGSNVASQTVVHNGKPTQPANPTRSGYYFMGWYKDATHSLVFNFETDVILGNTIIYARWEAIPVFDVTFVKHSGQDPDEVVSVLEGDTVDMIADPIRFGYSFVRWEDSEGNLFIFTNPITDHTMIHAAYTENTYQINYVYPEEATVVDEGSSTFTINSTSIPLKTLSIQNGTFVGWANAAVDGSLVVAIDPNVLADITLYAVFDMDPQYTVTFDPNNGNDTFDVVTYYGYIQSPMVPTKTGYVFNGWYIDLEDTEPFDFEETIISADLELIAKYDLVTYTIEYVLNEGTVNIPNPTTYTIESDDIILNPAGKVHYDFVGWFFELSGEAEPITSIETGTSGNLTLYAGFSPKAYTITYHLDGGTALGELFEVYYFDQSTFNLAPLEKEGYYFEGWFDAEEGGNKINQIVNNSYGDLELFARFYEEIEVYYLDDLSIEASNFFTLYFEGETTWFALDQQEQLYAKGSNQLGFLGYGEMINDAPMWILIQDQLGLAQNEYVTHYFFEAPMIVLITSENRLISWGFQGFDEGEPVVYYEPTDITAHFMLNGADIVEASHLFYHFAIITSDERLLMYGGGVTDVTPTLTPNESLSFSELFSTGEFNYSNVIYTGERIFIHFFGEDPSFMDVTSFFDFEPSTEILFVMSQGQGIHVITTNLYYFLMIGYDDEELMHMAFSLDLDLTLNSGEAILHTIAGGGLYTSNHRILLPVYYTSDPESEIPEMIIYHDVTDDLGLEVGETIVAYFAPFFILTSADRMLLIVPGDSFTDDLEGLPEYEILEIDLSLYITSPSDQISVKFNYEEVIFVIGDVAYTIVFSMEGIELEGITFEARSVIHVAHTPIHLVQTFFTPEDRMYQDFAGWYLDQGLTELASSEDLFDGIFLYAKWVDTHYKITFDLGWQYDGEPYEMIIGEFGTIPTAPPIPEVEYYEFVTWYYFDADGFYQAYDFTEPLYQSITLFASFTSVRFDVTFVFDLTEDSQDAEVWAFTEAQYLYIPVPYGYTVIGLYFDEEMTLEVPHDYVFLSNYTLYVKLEAETYEVYYFESYEELSFEMIYGFIDAQYGVTLDGRIFARGFNDNGSLGLGSSIYTFHHFVEMTHLFDFEVGETVVFIDQVNQVRMLYTSLGRVFLWGYELDYYEHQATPVEMTQMFTMLMGDQVVFVYADYNDIYFYTEFGDIFYIDTHTMTVLEYHIPIAMQRPKFMERYGFGEHYIVVLEHELFELDFNHFFVSLDFIDHKSQLEGYKVVDVVFNTLDYQGYLAIQENGRLFQIYPYSQILTAYGMINLNFVMSEFVVQVYDSTNGLIVGSNLGNYYRQTQIETLVIDHSALEVGEYLIAYNYQYGNYYSNLGNIYYLDNQNGEFYASMAFAPHDGVNDYIDYVIVLYPDFCIFNRVKPTLQPH